MSDFLKTLFLFLLATFAIFFFGLLILSEPANSQPYRANNTVVCSPSASDLDAVIKEHAETEVWRGKFTSNPNIISRLFENPDTGSWTFTFENPSEPRYCIVLGNTGSGS